jgi:hypothetical protein
MVLRRLISVLSVCVVATGSIVAAAPGKAAPKATPAAAKKGSGSGSGSGSAPATAGSGSAAAPDPAGSAGGSAVAPIEDTPPSDMNGTDENPDAPKGVGMEAKVAVKTTAPAKPAEYPVEEVQRPITLPQNMSEIGIAPHVTVGDGSSIPMAFSDALRARYGITKQIQLGFTYVYAGVYNDPANATMNYTYNGHAGKAIGLDATYLIQDWIGVRLGVPLYLDPVAVSLSLGAPLKFRFADKFAVGGFDDLLNIRLSKFAPDFYQEYYNAVAAQGVKTNTTQSNGHLRFAIYGEYQAKENLAVIVRAGIDTTLGSGGGSVAGTTMTGGTATFLRAGVQLTPRKFIDVGGSLGFDDLAHLGSFTPLLFLNVRI